jgi:hypothetical protein
MAEFLGSAVVFQWINPAGTLALTGDHRRVSISPAVDLYEKSAGSDADKTYLPGIKDATVSYEGVQQSAGTATEDALVEGTEGTLIIGPEGTASGKRKYTIPAISMGANVEYPYNDVAILSCEFQKSGALTRSVY